MWSSIGDECEVGRRRELAGEIIPSRQHGILPPHNVAAAHVPPRGKPSASASPAKRQPSSPTSPVVHSRGNGKKRRTRRGDVEDPPRKTDQEALSGPGLVQAGSYPWTPAAWTPGRRLRGHRAEEPPHAV